MTLPDTKISDTDETTDHDALIASLDLATKVRLLTGGNTFTMAGEPSIGLAPVNLSDGPTGVRGLKFSGGRTVSLFPNATLLSAAWSEDAAYEVGELLAEEAMAQEISVVLGPTINLHRSVLGGRLFEAYSEDPLLTGKLAAAYVKGLQSKAIGACLKHLVANESETLRNSMNSVLDEATLRELYLLPFEIAVEESNPWSMMAAYNDVNGIAATEQDHVNNEVVKGEWGYDGLIMSDWFATKTAAAAAKGGLDLVMPGPNGPWGDVLVAAVEAGEVDESVIDDHLRRILVLADRVGGLSAPSTGLGRVFPTDLPAPDSATRKEQLTRLAANGITVLTNRPVDGAPALPLATGTTVALIGRHAIETIDMGGGSAQVNPPYQVSVAEGLTALLGDGVTVVDGVEVRSRAVAARNTYVTDPVTQTPGVRIRLYAADGSLIEERSQSTAVTIVGFDDDFTEIVDYVVLSAKIDAVGAVEVGGLGVGDWVLTNGDATSSFEVRGSGTGFGDEMLAPPSTTSVVELNDSGVIELTARRPEPTGPVDESSPFSAPGFGFYGLIARPVRRDPAEVIAEAVVAATDADVAVVVVGLTEEQETEAVDKATIELFGDQNALVSAVAAAARRTVVVVNSATPLVMPWVDEVDAVLWAGLPGQEGGHAIAATLLGTIEPAGRLVTTFPSADQAAPAWSVTPVDGVLTYDEGTFIGYRGHYADRAAAPAFWLGHGLGYATWAYGGADLVAGNADASPIVETTVTNTSDRDSREVVQVYFAPVEDDEPVRLVGWTAVEVAAGESVDVRVTTDARLWRRWDSASDRWGEPLRAGELLVARGLGDIRARVPLS